ncbi:MAG: hypothetical protein CO187_04245 [Zetaproteobacteria bacterium CG_4_9_14_3_um_filter_53_7]|nr:MAG: hypothetical protein CO187_04245 [Zetaproteobacteria bacterium CG_4_9_14_3_um_filter_53_7]
MINGSCLCGQVRYEIDGEMGPITHCHCPSCQKAHATAFSSVSRVELDDLTFITGASLLKFYESSPGKKRYFCSNCGSQIYAKREDQNHYIFRMGTIDGDPGARPAQHIFTRYKAPWYNIHDDIPEFSEWPVEAAASSQIRKERQQLDLRIQSALALAARQGTATSLLLVNVSDTDISDIHDQIRMNVRDSDVVEQLDHKLFAVLLLYTDGSASIILAERICNSIKAATHKEGALLNVGAATLRAAQLHNEYAPGSNEIINMAEKALCASKLRGNKKIIHFNSISSDNGSLSEAG